MVMHSESGKDEMICGVSSLTSVITIVSVLNAFRLSPVLKP